MSFSTYASASSAPTSTRSFSPPNPFPSSLHTLAASLLLAACLAFLVAAPSLGQARVQIIHNSPDPSASTVDIYVDNDASPFVDDLSFRAATAFVDVPAGSREIDIAPGSSTGPGDAIFTETLSLVDGETYVVIASGVLDPSAFESNPNGVATDFQLLVQDGARESSTAPSEVQFIGVHGSTDAPTVDIRTRTGTTLLDDVSYTDISSYLGVAPQSYTLDVTIPNQNAIVASFTADLSGLAGGSAVVLASGFLTPGNDQNGEAFGLIAVLADGSVVTFPADDTQRADIQVVHNAAGFGNVDIYVLDPGGNQLTKLDDFPFRGALLFDVPAGEDLEVTVNASGSSNSGDQQVASVSPINLSQDSFNQAFAVGENASDFELQLQAGRSTGTGSDAVGLLVGHQSPDAPTVDVLTRGSAAVDGFSYKDFAPGTGYLNIPPSDYILRVGPDDNSTIVASFSAPLQTLGLGGSTLAVLASGFLNTTPSFTLIAVPPANQSTAADEIVEAANADQNVLVLAAAPQDLIINEFYANPSSTDDTNGDGTAGGDTEEEFVEVVNRSNATIDVSGYILTDAASNVYTFPQGVSIPAGDAATIFRGGTPTGIPGFSDAGLPALNNSGDEIILQDDSGTILDQITFPEFAPEQDDESTTRSPDFNGPTVLSSSVGPAFTPGFTNDGNTPLPVELAGFDALIDGSDVVLTWRTLSETNNSGFEVQQQIGGTFERIGFRAGQGTTNEATAYRFRVRDLSPGAYTFRLKQIDIDGTFAFSPSVDAVVQLEESYAWTRIAPNPVTQRGALTLQVRETQDVTVDVYDLLGRRVVQLHSGPMTSDRSHTLSLDAVALPSGTYFLRARGEAFTATQQITVVR